MKHKRCFTGCINENKLSCRKFVIRHLPIFVSDRTVNERKEIRRSRIKCGMTPLFNNGGFTLIELLVVVLIIGILAAVAVPQYQKAVIKSRATQLYTIVNAFAQATQRYHLANGDWPTAFDVLDIELPPGLQEQSQGTSICSLSGNGIIAKAKDFFVKIDSSAGSVMGIFITGNYQCAGLIYRKSKDKLYCIEIKGSGLFGHSRGDFCTKIMHMSLADSSIQTDGVDWFE